MELFAEGNMTATVMPKTVTRNPQVQTASRKPEKAATKEARPSLLLVLLRVLSAFTV